MRSCRRLLILLLMICTCLSQAVANRIFADVERNDVLAVTQKLNANPQLLNIADAAGQTMLQHAAVCGAADVAKLLLARGISLNGRGGLNHETALLKAINHDHFQIAALLIERKANVNLANDSGETPLRLALQKHNTKLVTLLRAHGGKLAIGNALFDAADRGDVDAINSLAAKNPRLVNAQDQGGWTPLHVAALVGRVQSVETLLARGAKVDSEDVKGLMPLHLAIFSGKVPVAELILAKGAGVDAGSIISPLMLAAFDSKKAMVELLLKKGADPNKRGQRKRSVLEWAVAGGSEEIITLLLKAGANPNLMDETGQTPLHLKTTVAIAKLLIANGADANACDNHGMMPWGEGDTPLHTAAVFGSLEVVKVLITAGANPSVMNKYGKTPLDLAQANHYPAVVDYLRTHGGQPGGRLPGGLYLYNDNGKLVAPLWYLANWLGAELQAAGDGKTTVTHGETTLIVTVGEDGVVTRDKATYVPVRTFCDIFDIKVASDAKRREVTLTNPETKETLVLPTWSKADRQWTTLALDAYGNSVTRLKARLEAGANPDLRDSESMTPMHWAARNGRLEIITTLLEYNATINARDDERQTPLHLAVIRGERDAVELLVAKGAVINTRSCFGRTPLHYAVEGANKGVVEFLLRKGAKIEVTDYNDSTPLDIAVDGKLGEIADLLKNFGKKPVQPAAKPDETPAPKPDPEAAPITPAPIPTLPDTAP